MSTEPVSPSYRDLRFCLIMFGVFLVLGGGLCLLFVPLLVLLPHLPAPEPEVEVELPVGMMYGVAVMYLVLGGAAVWLGIGSMLCRRWARALIQLASVFGLVCGALGMLTMVVLMIETGGAGFIHAGDEKNPLPESAIRIIQFVSIAAVGVIYLIIPGIFAWFYSLRSTRLTCEARDPKVRWTDRLPLPLLGLVLLFAMMAVGFAGCLAVGPVFPVFGYYLTGGYAVGAGVFVGAALGVCAWQLSRRSIGFWWVSLGLATVLSLSYAFTFLTQGFLPLYEHLNLGPEMFELMAKNPMVHSKAVAYSGLLYLVPVVALMLYCRRWFGGTEPKVPDHA